MKPRWIVPLGLTLLFAAQNLTAEEKEADKKFEATCPVSGKPAKESSSLELKDGGKAYFCCENCPKAFKADPDKYATKVNRQLLETGQVVQVACPVSGKAVNKDAMVELGNQKIGFCCEHCVAEFKEASDDKKLDMAFGEVAFKKGFTRQTKCPVSDKPINPTAFVEHQGEKVYFCCPGCPKAFEENPEKYVAKLPQFAKKRDDKK